jgi:hypothetical protein
MFSPD